MQIVKKYSITCKSHILKNELLYIQSIEFKKWMYKNYKYSMK